MKYSKYRHFVDFCRKHNLDMDFGEDRSAFVRFKQANGDWYFVYDGEQDEYFVYFHDHTGMIKHYRPHPQVFFGVFRHKLKVARALAV